MVHYVMECLQLMALAESARRSRSSSGPTTDYVAEIDAAMAGTVWCHTPTAHTYYRSGGGRIVTAFPYRLIDVWQSPPGSDRRGLRAAMSRIAHRQNGIGHRQ